jgi:hypothetical protein
MKLSIIARILRFIKAFDVESNESISSTNDEIKALFTKLDELLADVEPSRISANTC